MGAWGHESCACDGCWDLLTADNIHKMTQKEADKDCLGAKKYLLKENWKPKYDNQSASEALGVIVWVLNQELTADKEILRLALDTANRLLECKEHTRDYDNEEERIHCLQEEINQIEFALQNNGKGQKKHVRGLFERMAENGL